MVYFFLSKYMLCSSLLLGILDQKPQTEHTVDPIQVALHKEKEELLASPLGPVWKSFGLEPKDGISISLAGLHSSTSCGIGEFTDLIPLLPWCKELGLKVIQLLPLNDSEQSPYTLISSCALNPRYLGLRALPNFEKFPNLKLMADALAEHNNDLRIDLSFISQEKNKFLEVYFKEMGKSILESDGYKQFLEENKQWITEYGLFKAIRELYTNTLPWTSWSPEHRNLKENKDKLIQTFANRIEFYSFVQYLCFDQLNKVTESAYKHEIFLMADLPFTVAKNSADMYAYPEIFYSNLTLGAAPDIFASDGQNWNLPVYNWPAIQDENYNWWSRRIKLISKNFGIYRLDHALGFYRQWAIGEYKAATEGEFIPQKIKDRITLGEENLNKFISFSSCLPVAETFGGGDVKDILKSIKKLGIPNIKVSTWEKDSKNHFINLQKLPFTALLTISLHDTDIFAGSWIHTDNISKEYAYFKHWRQSHDPTELDVYYALLDVHQSNCCLRVNPLQEYLWLIPDLTHLFTEEERINIPGTVSPWNWGYRYVPSVEDIIHNSYLKKVFIALFNGQEYPVPPMQKQNTDSVELPK